MGTRVLSLWLPYLEIDRFREVACSKGLNWRRAPRATCSEIGDGSDRDGRRLAALCPLAERAGLRPGMGADEALRRVPGLVLHAGDPDLDRRFLQTLAGWCERYTPFVALDRSHGLERGGALWLDIGSSAHLSGGEAKLLVDLLGRFRQKGITVKAAIADHPGSAWAACRFGDDERRILPVNGARVALASFPIAALRLDHEAVAKLENAGLDRIEHLYALPRRSLSARFGDRVATRLDQALGLIDEPIAADQPLPAQQAQLILADPITAMEALPQLIERLVRQLCIGLEAAGLGARRLALALYRVDNSTVTLSVGTHRPCRDIERLTGLIGRRLAEVDIGFGLERVILDAAEIEPMLPETIRWRGLGTAVDDALPDLADDPDDWMAGCEGAALAFRPRKPPALPKAAPAMVLRTSGGAATAAALAPSDLAQPTLHETLPRPLRLLRQPEPIEAIASLPGEPPVLFRWRNRLHKVTGAKGPETISPDRWRLPPNERARLSDVQTDPSPVRDYFAVEDSEGERFWLFREGRYEAGSTALPRWFLHGLFG